MRFLHMQVLAWTMVVASPAMAIDDLFEKQPNKPYSGFQVPEAAAYLKECSGCHFVYSPGMLPARSWSRLFERLDSHFGESLSVAPDAREDVLRYLSENAADRSRYSGSKVLMESLPNDLVPLRVQSMPRLLSSHRVMREVIKTNARVKVRTLVNCDGCHQQAVAGDFGQQDLRIEGLSALSLIRSRSYNGN